MAFLALANGTLLAALLAREVAVAVVGLGHVGQALTRCLATRYFASFA